MINCEFKPNIQLKLESWKRSVPSEESLQLKLTAASQRREDVIVNLVQRVAKHIKDVKETVKSIEMRKNIKAVSLGEELKKKQTIASKRRNNLMQGISLTAQLEMNLISRSNEEKNAINPKKKLERRQTRALLNREKIKRSISEKFSVRKGRISKMTETVKISLRDLEDRLGEKMHSAIQRKDYIHIDIVKTNKKKQINVKVVQMESNQKVKELAVNHKAKLCAANQRKSRSLLGISSNVASITNKKYQRALTSRGVAKSSVLSKHELKMKAATERKDFILAEIVGSNQKQLMKAKTIQDENTQKRFDLAIYQKAKLLAASERKNKVLSDISSSFVNNANKDYRDDLITKNVTKLLDLSVFPKKSNNPIIEAGGIKIGRINAKSSKSLSQIISEMKNLKVKLHETQSLFLESKKKDNMVKMKSRVPAPTPIKKIVKQDESKLMALNERLMEKQTLVSRNKQKLIEDASSKFQSRKRSFYRSKKNLEVQNSVKVKALEKKLEMKQTRAYLKREEWIQSYREKILVKKDRSFSNIMFTIEKLQDLDERLNCKFNVAIKRRNNILTDIVRSNKHRSSRVKAVKYTKFEKINNLLFCQMDKLAMMNYRKNRALLYSSSKVANITNKKYQRALISRDIAQRFKLSFVKGKYEGKMNSAVKRKDSILRAIVKARKEKTLQLNTVKQKKIQNEKDLALSHNAKYLAVNERKIKILSIISSNVTNTLDKKHQRALISRDVTNVFKSTLARKNHEHKMISVKKNKDVIIDNIREFNKKKMIKVKAVQKEKVRKLNNLSIHHTNKLLAVNQRKCKFLSDISYNLSNSRNKNHRLVVIRRNIAKVFKLSSARNKLEHEMISSCSFFSPFARESDFEVLATIILEKMLTKKRSRVLKNKQKAIDNASAKIRVRMNRFATSKRKQEEQVNILEHELKRKQNSASLNRAQWIRSIYEKFLVNKDKLFYATMVKLTRLQDLEDRMREKTFSALQRRHDIISDLVKSKKKSFFQVKAVKEKKLYSINNLKIRHGVKVDLVNERKSRGLLRISSKVANVTNKKHQRALISRDFAKRVKLSFTEKKHENKMISAAKRKEAILTAIAQSQNKKSVQAKVIQQKRDKKLKNLAVYHKAKNFAAEERRNKILSDISSNSRRTMNKKRQRALISRYYNNAFKSANVQKKHENAVQRRDAILADIVESNMKKWRKVNAVHDGYALRVNSLAAYHHKKVFAANQRKNKALSDVASNTSMNTQKKYHRALIWRNVAKVFKISIEKKLEYERISSLIYSMASSPIQTDYVKLACTIHNEMFLKKQIRAYNNKKIFIENKIALTKAMRRSSVTKKNVEEQKMFKVMVLKQKLEERQTRASLNREQWVKSVSQKHLVNKCRIASTMEYNLIIVQDLEDKLTYEMSAAVEQKNKIIADIVRSQKKKSDKIRCIQDSHFQQVNKMLVDHRAKLLAANQRKKRSLFAVSSNIANITSEKHRRTLVSKTVTHSALQKKLEDKMVSVSERKDKIIATKSSGMKQKEERLKHVLAAKIRKRLLELQKVNEEIIPARHNKPHNRDLFEEEKQSEEYEYSDPFPEFSRGLSDLTYDQDLSSKDMRVNDVKLSDIEILQSITLAEEAALNGKNEFKTVNSLDDLNKVKLSMSITQPKPLKSKSRLASKLIKVRKHVGEKVRNIKLPTGQVERIQEHWPITIRLHLPFST